MQDVFELKDTQSEADNLPVLVELAVGIDSTIFPLEVIGLFVTVTSLQEASTDNPTLVTVPKQFVFALSEIVPEVTPKITRTQQKHSAEGLLEKRSKNIEIDAKAIGQCN